MVSTVQQLEWCANIVCKPGSEHFRDIQRYSGETLPGVLLLRIDAALFFGNVDALLDRLATLLQERQQRGEQVRQVYLSTAQAVHSLAQDS